MKATSNKADHDAAIISNINAVLDIIFFIDCNGFDLTEENNNPEATLEELNIQRTQTTAGVDIIMR
jgi:hypothetical protein